MAAPSILTTGTFGSIATLASTTIAGAVQTAMRVTGLALSASVDIAKLKDGANVTAGIVAHNAVDTLKVDFIYKGSDFPRPTPLEVVTITSSSSTVINSTEWYYAGDLTATYSAGDFTKYTMTLYREYQEDCVSLVNI